MQIENITMATKQLNKSLHENISKIKNKFMTGVASVQPQKLIPKVVRREDEKLVIKDKKYDLNRNVYTVGFGKAVIGMVRPIEDLLKIPNGGSHLQRGIMSVPVGIKKQLANYHHVLPDEDSVVEIMEGAKNNIPDEDAFNATKMIVRLVSCLGEQDLLLILISGGGSALLPYPVFCLTLKEKVEIIQCLSHNGATITELNTVRKALSRTKGGQLALMTKAETVCVILSDIINSPLDMIASGPTVLNRDQPGDAIQILQKYNVAVPDHIKNVLKNKSTQNTIKEFSHVNNFIIGSIEIALSEIENAIVKQTGCFSLASVLSSSVCGEAAKVGAKMAELAAILTCMLQDEHQSDELLQGKLLQDLCVDQEKKEIIINTLANSCKLRCPIWLIFGGETTVTVTGSGRGGRNQEMVLSASISLEKIMKESSFKGEILFLSGGTDGIDGPTDAAGALTFWSSQNSSIWSQVQEARKQDLTPEDFLAANNSYTYFSQLCNGEYLLKPGHTGTNVMDIQILLINPHYE